VEIHLTLFILVEIILLTVEMQVVYLAQIHMHNHLFLMEESIVVLDVLVEQRLAVLILPVVVLQMLVY
tara:strand:+ start:122 stop:325 length:204 start_codon:yes stop_codon:yes gene_type:complete